MATILVVDDDAANRLLIAAVLAPRGHDVREACDGADALRAIVAEEPDLIVLDLSMSGMGGVAFLKALRNEHGDTPVVLYTATQPDAAMRDLMTLFNVASILPKPSEPADIARILEGALSRGPI
ncbi:MAG TPA: response regulator [Candidatus Baltobacteraceae bacterium]